MADLTPQASACPPCAERLRPDLNGMRTIVQPGPVAAERSQVVKTMSALVTLTLSPGRSLLAAVTEALAPWGTGSALLTIRGGALFPFAYAIPALPKTPDHAAYFSDTFRVDAPVRIDTAAVTYGQRNGQPWLHCHASWTQANGARGCGHVIPDEAYVDEAIEVSACLIEHAGFQVTADAETNFSLFQPQATGLPMLASDKPALAVRLAPNQDVCTALEDLCHQHGMTGAEVKGGVGSTVGALFDDGRVVEPFATEVLIRQGRVFTNARGELQAELDVTLVAHSGAMAEGRLKRGANAVLMTFELVLVPV